MDAPTPVSPALAPNTWYFRSMGAVIGAVLAFCAMGALYVASSLPIVESALFIRSFLTGDGFLSMGGGLPPWTVAPIAAALAGALCAPRTMAGTRWAGVTMGYLTYGIALLLAPLAVFAPPWGMGDLTTRAGIDIGEAVVRVLVGIPVIAVLAGVFLAPLLVVCGAAGIAWAASLRAVLRAGGATVATPDRQSIDGWLLFWTAVVLGLGWVTVAVGLVGVLGGGEFVD
jgi:hypothetical protein